jgi:hypothetical protein
MLTQRHSHYSLTVAGHDDHHAGAPDAIPDASRSQLRDAAQEGDEPPRTRPGGPPPALFAAGYLATGTALALMGQVVTNQGAADPSSQLVAWTRYLCTFSLSLAVQAVSRPQRTVMTRNAKRLVLAVG